MCRGSGTSSYDRLMRCRYRGTSFIYVLPPPLRVSLLLALRSGLHGEIATPVAFATTFLYLSKKGTNFRGSFGETAKLPNQRETSDFHIV